MRIFLSVVVSGLVLLAGCARDDGNAQGDEAAVTAAPITLENFVTHPKIKAVRADVARIDGAGLTKTVNPGCDGNTTKHTDARGQIRKHGELGGEGGFTGEITAWYADEPNVALTAARKLRFVLATAQDFDEKRSTESRVYFDDEGRVMWQVIREAKIGDDRRLPDMSTVPDRLPTAEEKFAPDHDHLHPEEWFKKTGCPTP